MSKSCQKNISCRKEFNYMLLVPSKEWGKHIKEKAHDAIKTF
jgi:hypothetical protein